MSTIKTCRILGVNIAVTNMAQTVQYIENNLEELRGKYICVSNVHTTIMAHDNPAYRNVQNSAAIALPDGKPLSVVSRKRGYTEAERVTGPDLMGELFARENGLKHFFYGDKEETLQILQQKLKEKYPDIQIAGMISPPFRSLSQEEEKAYIQQINDSGADIIWIGLGAPKQENWMYEHQGMFQGVMIGVGAGFSYHAGLIKRAPEWMQKMSLEWFYRLMQDPVRLFKRYFTTNLKFILLEAKDKGEVL
ncbi:WecB/TagA/CpsF family glycosyltransferase [bacterium]|nr:WecB/TagA/CpsF family glycosyltransferase [bacterium]